MQVNCMRCAVQRPGQINAVAIAAATILKASRGHHSRRLAAGAVSRSAMALSAFAVSCAARVRISAAASRRFRISFSALALMYWRSRRRANRTRADPRGAGRKRGHDQTSACGHQAIRLSRDAATRGHEDVGRCIRRAVGRRPAAPRSRHYRRHAQEAAATPKPDPPRPVRCR